METMETMTADECMAQSEARRLSIATGRVGGMRRRPRPVCDFCGKPLVGGRMCHDCGIDYREEQDFQGDD